MKLTGRPNGYFSNPDIKILMPSNLRTLEKGLRMVGYGPKVDDFVLSMNRAAEAAAPAARKIFIDAITAMSFDDARRILSGGDTAATNYFKEKTTPQLTVAFRPVVEKTMSKNGVTQQYNSLVSQYKKSSLRQKSGPRYQSLRGVKGARWALLRTGPGRAQDPPGPGGADYEPVEGSLRATMSCWRRTLLSAAFDLDSAFDLASANESEPWNDRGPTLKVKSGGQSVRPHSYPANRRAKFIQREVKTCAFLGIFAAAIILLCGLAACTANQSPKN